MKNDKISTEELETLCNHSTHMEILATKAERDSVKLMQIKYMLDKEQYKISESQIIVKSGPGKVGIFSTEFLLPSNSYQGKYFVRYFIFQNGEFMSYAENKIDLKQAGFSRLISLTAENFPLLYGILAVILSGSLGWLISIIFRRLKIS